MTIVPNEPKQIFAANLKAKVVQLGLTHEQAAERVGVKERTFRDWIYGVNYPPTPALVKIAEAFEVDDLYLFLIKRCA